ncbi:MAG TPA: Asp-tRNA(Asn)/Glu-tRNA(Gln) amidotransferase subunit GatA [Candidatus Babeliales bacterium]|nr:Asp-tRNA(Asn)/Glu-tRNA(Gln) amidotransferase subunit GatA [Candidatus Babeliales bacterium]
MNNLAFATIDELRSALEKKEISSKELLNFHLERFSKYDKTIGSSLEIFNPDSIVAESAASGKLFAIPGIIKDNICQKNRITSCGSKILQNYSAPYDATAIARLKSAGAFLVGRANCDEFAMGSSTETSAYQKTMNPWDVSRVPGGSSGGSIAAVAAGFVPWALGSETGGSVRQPAAFCGIVGFKPTYGLISRYGLVAYASSFDQIGIATRTVKDTAHVLSVIAGHDERDSTTLQQPTKDYAATLNGKIKPGMRIGIIENALYAEGVDAQVVSAIEQAVKELERLGATIKRITLPVLDYSAAVYFILSRAEAASNLSRFDGVRYGLRVQKTNLEQMYAQTREQGFGKEVKARIMIGNYVLSVGHAGEFYVNAKKVQGLMRNAFNQAFEGVDLLVAPTHPAPAFKFGAFDENKLQMDLQDYFTCAMNITGIPAISIPCGMSSENLPIGFQLIAPHNGEELMLQTAHAFEKATPWHKKHPQGFGA